MLHRLKKLHGMSLAATDGEIGKVTDVYFDDVSWGIRYLIVETGWLSGRKVLISPRSVRSIDWNDEKIHVVLSQQQVKDSPDIDTDQPVSRQEETEFLPITATPFIGAAATCGARIRSCMASRPAPALRRPNWRCATSTRSKQRTIICAAPGK